MSPTFDYMFADDPKTTMPELRARHGQHIEVVRPCVKGHEYDYEGEEMFLIRFDDGFETTCWQSEIIGDGGKVLPLIEDRVPLAEQVDTKSIRITTKVPVPDPIRAIDVRRDEPLMPTKKDMRRRPRVTDEEE